MFVVVVGILAAIVDPISDVANANELQQLQKIQKAASPADAGGPIGVLIPDGRERRAAYFPCATCEADVNWNDTTTIGGVIHYRGEYSLGVECIPPDGEYDCMTCESLGFPGTAWEDCEELYEEAEEGEHYHTEELWNDLIEVCGNAEGCYDTEEVNHALIYYDRADYQSLRALVAASEGSLFVNSNHNALQGFDCHGRMVLNLPLSEDAFRALTAPRRAGMHWVPAFIMLAAMVGGSASRLRRKAPSASP